MAESKELTTDQKVDKLLLVMIELVRNQAEIVEQQAEIIEKLGNISISGEGFSFGEN